MKQLALYREADSVVPVEYVAQDGWYYFTDPHGEPKVCKQNPEARPYPLTELGALLPLEGNWITRRIVKRAIESLAYEGGSLRFFEGVNGAVAELPVGNVVNGWRDFLHDAASQAVTHDDDGTAILNLHSVPAMRDDLRKVGVKQSVTDRFLVHLVNLTRSGHNAQFLKPNLLRFLLPAGAATGLLIVGLGIGIIFGVDMGADPLISTWWYDSNIRTYLTPSLLLFGGFLYLRYAR